MLTRITHCFGTSQHAHLQVWFSYGWLVVSEGTCRAVRCGVRSTLGVAFFACSCGVLYLSTSPAFPVRPFGARLQAVVLLGCVPGHRPEIWGFPSGPHPKVAWDGACCCAHRTMSECPDEPYGPWDHFPDNIYGQPKATRRRTDSDSSSSSEKSSRSSITSDDADEYQVRTTKNGVHLSPLSINLRHPLVGCVGSYNHHCIGEEVSGGLRCCMPTPWATTYLPT